MHPSDIVRSIKLDKQAAAALYIQLYGAIKAAILNGQILPGMQLPPSREFSLGMQISRQTVLNAYEKLLAEGYLRGAVGHGTFVNENLPEIPINHDRQLARQPMEGGSYSEAGRLISKRGLRYADANGKTRFHQGASKAFRVGMPDLSLFPFDIWARLEARRWRRPEGQLGYSDPAGYMRLRELLAVYLKASRGVNCTPDQIIITSGSQQALYLLSTILLDAGDKVWLESPCYRGASAPLHAAQADICPIPVDDEGLNVEYGRTHFPDARMIFVTPSHQMPLGMTMSLQRRMELLAWAQEKQTWILEDDYDSEYRFSGAPLASLQSLDRHGRVIYVGTMSKVLFPGLRLGYMVAPANLVDSLVQAKSIIDKHTAIVPQMVLADFIAEGHFGRHIKRMRKVYAERQRVLVETIESELSDELRCGAKDGGMDIAVFFKKNWSEQRIIDEGAARSLELRGLAHYAHAERNTEHLPHASGLLLGFSSMDSTAIRQGLMVLKEILTGHLNKT